MSTVTGDTYETEDDTANAFLALMDVEKPSEENDESETPEAEEAEEGTEESSEADETEATEEDGESSSEEEAEETEDKPAKTAKKYADEDGTYIKVKVGDEEHEVPVKDLKRLFGQEASLTKKSQEVAARTKQADEAQARSLAALDVMVKRAAEAANPYRNINWAALMKDPNVSAEEVAALQETARAAFDNETFLTTQLNGFMQQVQAQQQATQREAAQNCIKALTDEKSPTYIKGWDQKLYDDLRTFAVSVGANKDMVNGLTDPSAFKLIHMAMQFHKGAQKVVTKKVDKSPKKIVKSSVATSAPDKGTSKTINRKQTVAKMKKAGGTMQAAEDAFLALLGGDE